MSHSRLQEGNKKCRITTALLLPNMDKCSFSHQVGGIYFGGPRGFGTNDKGERMGYNTMVYSESEVRI